MKLNFKLPFDSKNYLFTVTYNLIYPAFFGNMVYDIILRKSSSGLVIESYQYYTLWIILLYFILDFLHLNAELNPESNKELPWIYMIADILTSLFFFLAFVCVKEGKYCIAMFLILSIPVIMLAYNLEKKHIIDSKNEKLFQILFEKGINKIICFYCFFIAINIIPYMVCRYYFDIPNENLVFPFSVSGFAFYAIYVFGFYHYIKDKS